MDNFHKTPKVQTDSCFLLCFRIKYPMRKLVNIIVYFARRINQIKGTGGTYENY